MFDTVLVPNGFLLAQLPQFEVKNGRKSLISNARSGKVGTTLVHALGDFEAFGKDQAQVIQ